MFLAISFEEIYVHNKYIIKTFKYSTNILKIHYKYIIKTLQIHCKYISNSLFFVFIFFSPLREKIVARSNSRALVVLAAVKDFVTVIS